MIFFLFHRSRQDLNAYIYKVKVKVMPRSRRPINFHCTYIHVLLHARVQAHVAYGMLIYKHGIRQANVYMFINYGVLGGVEARSTMCAHR